jgi:hypothetical protein
MVVMQERVENWVALILFKGKWIHGSYRVSNIGLDVSTNPTINGDAVMKDVVLFTLSTENV